MAATKGVRGTSLLEFAMVLPVLLAFLLGAYDINRYLHVRSALRVAADTTLRCIYPSDSKCLDIASASPPSRLFDWYELNFTPTFNIPLLDFSGEATWNELPIERFTPQADVLGNVSFNAPRNSYTGRRPSQQQLGLLPRWERTHGFPAIRDSAGFCTSGLSFNGSAWRQCTPADPCACDDRTPTFEYGPNVTIAVNDSLETLSSTPQPFANAVFSIARPIDAPQSGGNFSLYTTCIAKNGGTEKSCDSLWPQGFNPGPSLEITDHTYLVIWVTGVHYQPSAAAQVLFTLQRKVGSSWVDVQQLNGQSTTGSGASNFWPRGAHSQNSNQNQFSNGFSPPSNPPDASATFHSPLRVKYGETYRLHFTLHKEGGVGSVNYRVKDVFIWHPSYALNLEKYEACPGQFPINTAADNSTCPHSPPYPQFVPNPAVNGEIVKHSCAGSFTEAQSNLPGYTIDPALGAACAGTSYLTENCPAAGQNGNFGYSSYTPAQRLAICRPSNSAAFGISWGKINHGFPAQQWIKNCNQPHPAPCAAMASYLDVFWGTPQLIGWQSIAGDPQDPSAPDCATRRELQLNDQTASLPSNSLFKGTHPPLGCNWEEILQNDALQSGLLPPFFVFDGSSLPVGSSKSYSEPNPATCTPYSPGPPEDTSRVFLGELPEGVMPPECQSGTACEAVFSGYVAGDKGSAGKIDLDLAVKEFGFKELSASVPKAMLNCTGPNCVRFNVNLTASIATAELQYELPVLMLGSKSISIKQSVVEKLERAILE